MRSKKSSEGLFSDVASVQQGSKRKQVASVDRIHVDPDQYKEILMQLVDAEAIKNENERKIAAREKRKSIQEFRR